jgi:hypothetical protein
MRHRKGFGLTAPNLTGAEISKIEEASLHESNLISALTDRNRLSIYANVKRRTTRNIVQNVSNLKPDFSFSLPATPVARDT